jgi:hypothetical protein
MRCSARSARTSAAVARSAASSARASAGVEALAGLRHPLLERGGAALGLRRPRVERRRAARVGRGLRPQLRALAVDALEVALQRRGRPLGVGRAALGERRDLLRAGRRRWAGLRGERELRGPRLGALLAAGRVLLRAGDDDLQVLGARGGLRELGAQRAPRGLRLGQARLELGQARARALGLRPAGDEEALGLRAPGLEPGGLAPGVLPGGRGALERGARRLELLGQRGDAPLGGVEALGAVGALRVERADEVAHLLVAGRRRAARLVELHAGAERLLGGGRGRRLGVVALGAERGDAGVEGGPLRRFVAHGWPST